MMRDIRGPSSDHRIFFHKYPNVGLFPSSAVWQISRFCDIAHSDCAISATNLPPIRTKLHSR